MIEPVERMQNKGKTFCECSCRQVAYPTVNDFEDVISSPHLHLLSTLALIYFVLCLAHFASLMLKWLASAISFTLAFVPYAIIISLLFGALLNGSSPVFQSGGFIL